MARGRRGRRRKSPREQEAASREGHPERRRRGRALPLVAGVAAVPIGLTLAGALILHGVGDETGPADGSPTLGASGEGVADDSMVPGAEEDDDFFVEPTASPERDGPGGDSGPRSDQATASYSPEDTAESSDRPNSDEDGGASSGPRATAVVNLVNEERAAQGCDPVHVDGRLTAAAQEHSEDMAARDYMAHDNPDGEGPGDRARRHGYSSWGAENVAKGQSSAEQVMEAWMNSPGHRANILNCDLTAIGVGEASNAWTQKFGYE
ncbi:CAP domain-containing protein [Nocardiopsis alba]|uniref:Cysteine-rich secretory family protein n=1 Tax=Nocardiopsis alba (strain ATCC BAA-2165 / BE74) TaxID=1205910 RepID=J7LEW8_NOCAA|nr:CAP domain-containing protein [Nocardiopsis alba]AFR09072.1 cysteine-rich secretory family protein [Nocardiopsis alba ATCC BAA-2165]